MKSHQQRSERSEQHSRAPRVNGTRTHKTPRSLQNLKGHQDAAGIHKAMVQYQFQEIFQPRWFGSIQWQPFITEYSDAVKEARHFNLKFFCSLLDTRPRNLPKPPERPRIIWFHEKAPVLINPQEPNNPRYKVVYHSHFHLEESPDPYNSWIRLDWLVRNKVAKGFHRLSTSNSTENKGFVLKPWVREHHANYNFKDYYRYKHDQDADLVLDIWNSDLQFTRD